MPRSKVLYHASGKKQSVLHPTYGNNPRRPKKLYTTDVAGPRSRKGTAAFYADQYGSQKQNHGRAYIHKVKHEGFHRDDIGPKNYTTSEVRSSRKASKRGRSAEFVSEKSHKVIGGRWVKTHDTPAPKHTSIQQSVSGRTHRPWSKYSGEIGRRNAKTGIRTRNPAPIRHNGRVGHK